MSDATRLIAAAVLACILSACGADETTKAVVVREEPQTQKDSVIVIDIGMGNELYVDGVELPSDELIDRLRSVKTEKPNASVSVRPHAASSNTALLQAFDAALQAGIGDVSVAQPAGSKPAPVKVN